MERREMLDRKVAALSIMKISLESSLRRTEWCVLGRGHADPEEARAYLEDLERLRDISFEMTGTLIELASATDSPYGKEEIRAYDESLLRKMDEDEILSEIEKELETARKCQSPGERIRLIRQRKGMSSYQLAKSSGIDRATIQRYESGKIKTVTAGNMERLAKALDVSPAVIAGWEPV